MLCFLIVKLYRWGSSSLSLFDARNNHVSSFVAHAKALASSTSRYWPSIPGKAFPLAPPVGGRQAELGRLP